VQLDSDSFLPAVGGSYLKHLTNIIYQPVTATLQPGQIAIDTVNGALMINTGERGGQQTLFFDSSCPAGTALVSDGKGNWECGYPIVYTTLTLCEDTQDCYVGDTISGVKAVLLPSEVTNTVY
jgi:hypothetical protein